MGKLAFSHPGKLGDALYALPTIKYLCNHYNTTGDFYTSKYCKPLTKLFEYQSCIDKVIIPPEYEIERMDIGIQPWLMPIPSDQYTEVFQLGFKQVPDKAIHQFIAESVGIRRKLDVKYEYPDIETHSEPYIVIAPKGETTFKDLFVDVITASPIDTVVIGGRGEVVGSPTVDVTSLDMLGTVIWLSKASGFVGLMSSQLALANGFGFPKIAPHDGKSWDMRHVVNGFGNFYPINPSTEEVLELLKAIKTYSKTLDVKDYDLITEHMHVENIKNLIGIELVAYDHHHRLWEYGLILNALRKNKTRTVLDVGGGGSAFAPSAAWLDMEVLQMDVSKQGLRVAEQSKKLGRTLNYLQQDFSKYEANRKFDAVVCISVLEHVVEDVKFFKKLLSFVNNGGLIAITVDFHPDGLQRVEGHFRTYNEDSLQNLISIAKSEGFKLFGGKPDYTDWNEEVYDYTFASLVMERTGVNG